MRCAMVWVFLPLRLLVYVAMLMSRSESFLSVLNELLTYITEGLSVETCRGILFLACFKIIFTFYFFLGPF